MADGLAFLHKRVLEPWDDDLGLGLGRAVGHVVKGEGDVEGVLPWDEVRRDEIAAGGGVRVVVTTIALLPIEVPGTAEIVHRVVAASRFADPEDGGDDAGFPRIFARHAEGTRSGGNNH